MKPNFGDTGGGTQQKVPELSADIPSDKGRFAHPVMQLQHGC
jgi:hypothetical protein